MTQIYLFSGLSYLDVELIRIKLNKKIPILIEKKDGIKIGRQPNNFVEDKAIDKGGYKFSKSRFLRKVSFFG